MLGCVVLLKRRSNLQMSQSIRYLVVVGVAAERYVLWISAKTLLKWPLGSVGARNLQIDEAAVEKLLSQPPTDIYLRSLFDLQAPEVR